MKEQIRKSHADLVEQGFMTLLHEMPENIKQLLTTASFLHYHPRRIVAKEDSISTPIRLVVNPTMTGLNLILPNGENRLGSINQILIGNRADPYAWASDISKLYNQLHLDESALPYSLFLYSAELDPEMKPAVWVMNMAWFGVTPTGGSKQDISQQMLGSIRRGVHIKNQADLFSSAAEHAGGAAVYAGRKLKNGPWSCSLMSAKSKPMKDTIPRNELSAIM